MANTPPPPPGFVLDTAIASAPPPPPGFVLDSAAQATPQQPPQSVADRLRHLGDRVDSAIAGNATEELPSVYAPEFEAYTGKTTGARVTAAVRATPSAIFGRDEDVARKAFESVPGSKLDADGNGNPVLVTPDGKRFYINEPGLDRDDVLRLGANLASYLPAARIAAGFRGLLARTGVMGAGSGATNLAGQAAGREEVDLGEAGLVTAFGAGGELVAPIAGASVRYLRKALGRTPTASELGREFGTRMGIDTSKLDRKQLEHLGELAEQQAAGASNEALAGEAEFGFRYTQGQKTGDHAQLSREELLRQGQGPAPDQLRGVADANRQQLDNTVTDIGTRLGGGQKPTSPVDAFGRTQRVVQEQAGQLGKEVDDAYAAARASAPKRRVSPASVQALPDRLRKALGETMVDANLTPATSAALRRIEGRVTAMNRPGAKDAFARDLGSIETERRIVNSAINGAQNATDRRALMLLKREYDRWIDDAYAEVLGTDALIPIKKARELRAHFGMRFEGRGTDAAMDNFIESLVSGGKSPDELINIAYGVSQVSKPGASRYVQRLKVAFGDNREALDGLRAAHFMKLTTGKNGELLGMPAIRNNILGTERNAPATVRELYSDAEWGQLKRLASALEPLIPKGDFARSSGSAERMARMLTSMRALPGVRVVIDRWSEMVRSLQAQGAMQPVRAPIPGYTVVPAASAGSGSATR